MNWQLLVPLLLTTLLAIGGWIAAHQLNAKRDLKNKQREMVVNYLVEAYRKIVESVEGDIEKWKGLESAITDVQLFGTAHQVKLAQKAVQQMLETRNWTIVVDLLKELRRDLRKELQLEPLDEDRIAYIRFPSNQSPTENLEAKDK